MFYCTILTTFFHANARGTETRGTKTVFIDNTVDRRLNCRGELRRLLPNPNALVGVSKDMRAIKVCKNKILRFEPGPFCYPVTVLGKLFTPIVPLFTKQQN